MVRPVLVLPIAPPQRVVVPLPPMLTRRPSAGVVTVGDHIDMAPAGNMIRVDLWGVVIDGRVSAYIDPAVALRFAVELSRLARQVS